MSDEPIEEQDIRPPAIPATPLYISDSIDQIDTFIQKRLLDIGGFRATRAIFPNGQIRYTMKMFSRTVVCSFALEPLSANKTQLVVIETDDSDFTRNFFISLMLGIARNFNVPGVSNRIETPNSLPTPITRPPQRTAPSARQVIEKYKRRHARNPRITLKEVCEQMGVNYESIRAAKSRYKKQKKSRSRR